MEDGHRIYSELTKKQKELLQPFDALILEEFRLIA
jgi:hypothetical protein